jgi:hypothetical protein
MSTENIIGLIIASIAVAGGLGVAVLAILKGKLTDKEEKLALIEANNKERLAMIEKGLDPSVLDKKIEQGGSYAPLLWGLLLVGVGFGAFTGYIISVNNNWERHLTVHSMGMLFGGFGLIIYYICRRIGERKKTG